MKFLGKKLFQRSAAMPKEVDAEKNVISIFIRLRDGIKILAASRLQPQLEVEQSATSADDATNISNSFHPRTPTRTFSMIRANLKMLSK
jgi:hypothetical protein